MDALDARSTEDFAPIVMGTDDGGPLTRHGPSVFQESEAMQAWCLTANEVLVARTRGAASSRCAAPVSFTGAPGEQLGFSLGVGGSTTGFLFGTPASLPIGGCGTCTLLVQSFATLPNPASFSVLGDANLIGGTFAVQGYSATGACLGFLSLGDTLDFTAW